RAERDVDHVVALYRRNGCWGTLAKANGAMLRGRDPVYRTLREYSRPYDLRRLAPGLWVSGENDVWDLVEQLDAHPHTRIVGRRQAKTLSRPDPFVRQVAGILQYHRPRTLAARRRRQGTAG
ncbi:MAG TPA: hypothetical protein VLA41_11650, partial [Burkholderiales bacterium]|nr:hypothetical protein [Burkholderiales bacterium]